MSIKKNSDNSTKKIYGFRHLHLTLGGKYLDPETITEVLGIEPDSSAQRGVKRDGFKRVPSYGYWMLEGKPSHGRINTQASNILKRVDSVKEYLGELIKTDDSIKIAELTLCIAPPDESLFSEGHLIKSEVLNAFTSLGIDLVITIYSEPL